MRPATQAPRGAPAGIRPLSARPAGILLFGALLWLGGLTVAAPAGAAETTTLPGTNGTARQPVDIQADNAIEWHQDQKAYVARGHASAVRGTSTIYADVLTAFYRETKEKGAEVFRIAAEGNVHIVSPSQEIFGDHGVYDTDRQVGMLTGQGLRLLTRTDVVTARDSLEYYEATKLAVARGDAIAVRGDKRLRADTLIAQFAQAPAAAAGAAKPGPAKPGAAKAEGPATSLDRLDGVGGVVITTAQDVALCDRVLYSASTEIAVLRGNVRITRGTDQINGDAAEMNMKTHVNRVLGTGRRVEGLLIPKADPSKKPGRDKAPD
ncbi:MAG: LptA/OstA family protein [Rhodospirillaceae bacterium]